MYYFFKIIDSNKYILISNIIFKIAILVYGINLQEKNINVS